MDEYQDINPAQEKLISLLAKPPVHLCVVADDDQAIYQWRGSDVSNMLEFKKRYKSDDLVAAVHEPPLSAHDHRNGQRLRQIHFAPACPRR